MLKDVGMIVPESIETSAVYICNKTGTVVAGEVHLGQIHMSD